MLLALMKAEGDADLMQFTVCFFFWFQRMRIDEFASPDLLPTLQ